MHRLSAALVGVVSAIAFTQIAAAADLPTKAPAYRPPVVVPYNWTGFYVGGNAGYGFGAHSDHITAIADPSLILADVHSSVPVDARGFIGGGQIGYNWQLSPTWLVGVEADFSGADINRTSSWAGNFGRVMTAQEKLDWLGTVRGRVGFLPADRFLAYMTGGLAYGHGSLSTALTRVTLGGCPNLNQCEAGSVSGTKTGWTIGGGVEWAFAPNWSARIEYLFVDLGTLSHHMTDPNFPLEVFNSSVSLQENIIRAGLNYKFGGPY
jgi:outer membrane immunogenic protein